MAYEDDREMELDEQSTYLEEDPVYGTDTYFGERLDQASESEAVDEQLVDEPVMTEDTTTEAAPDAESEDFGEKLSAEGSEAGDEPMEDSLE
jgi:hypothetical protein